MTGCDARNYTVHLSIPVVVEVSADSHEEAERAAMSQMANVRVASLFADVAVGFPVIVSVSEKELTASKGVNR